MCIVFPESIWGGICCILVTMVVKLFMFCSFLFDHFAFPCIKTVYLRFPSPRYQFHHLTHFFFFKYTNSSFELTFCFVCSYFSILSSDGKQWTERMPMNSLYCKWLSLISQSLPCKDSLSPVSIHHCLPIHFRWLLWMCLRWMNSLVTCCIWIIRTQMEVFVLKLPVYLLSFFILIFS